MNIRKILRIVSITMSVCMFGSISGIRNAYAAQASENIPAVNEEVFLNSSSLDKNNDQYVEKTSKPVTQKAIDVSSLNIAQNIKLADKDALPSVSSLYGYLGAVGKTDKVLFGHQNDTHHKAVLKNSGTNSDTKDLTGSISAICGIDALSLIGAELSLTDEEKNAGLTYVDKAVSISKDIDSQGGIITLSAHMPNFDEVVKKGKTDGKYDFSGYTPNVTTGDVVSRIMPGGDLNEAYTQYLDIIADYAGKMQASNIPILFRPFHENNGSWFWWGKAFCDEEGFKNLYRYTVEYMRDTKNIHNLLYVYSPNGPFENEENYLSRYPGDEFVDVLAFDMYDADSSDSNAENKWMNSFKETIDLVQAIGEKKNKVSAVSETGTIKNNNSEGLSLPATFNKDWFSNVSEIVSKSNMPYYMVWANFDTGNAFEPYMVDDTKGHDMINKFIDYYNEEQSVFADGTGSYKDVKAETDKSSYNYGFIAYPLSGMKITEPVTLKASVKGHDDVKFVVKNKAGEVISSIKASLDNGYYTGQLTKDILDKAGECKGSIDLYAGNEKLESISALFNFKEAVKDPKQVDNFENYLGEDSILQTSWSTNAGDGCSVSPKVNADNKNEGKYVLEFKYKISNEKIGEGWAGITKSVGADWSSCNALSLWCRPDGNGQKLVIQLTSNGEDFEVWLPEFAATTEAKVLTIPFSDFKGKNGGTLDLSKIEKMGIWCNTIVPDNHKGSWTVDSSMYFDDIKAVKNN